MEIKIEGNPETGNVYHVTHIDTVQNYNPNAQTVTNTTKINNVYGDAKKTKDMVKQQVPEADKVQRMTEIMQYVLKLKDYVAPQYKAVYERLWRTILALTEVSAIVCEPGTQQNTTFNRRLVANILHMMIEKDVFKDRNATNIAIALEGNKEHSVRGNSGANPDDKVISLKVKNAIDKALYG